MDFFKQFFAKKCAVGGLDLGTKNLKLVQLNQKKDKTYELTSLLLGEPPEGTLKDGMVADPRALGDHIKQLILSFKLKVEKVFGVASGQFVVLRPIHMAKLKPDELNKALRFQAADYLPYSSEDAMIKGMILKPELEDDPQQMEVLLMAAPNEIVKNTQDVIRFSGLSPAAVDMEPFALLSVLGISVEPEVFSKTISLVHIGASYTSINIYDNGNLKQSRIVKIAGNRLTEVIANAFDISFEEAEKLKEEKGIIRVEKDATPVAPTTTKIFNTITPVLSQLVKEIRRSFDYYERQFNGTIDNIVLSGGSAKFKNIDSYISNELGIKCSIINPFRNIDISKVQGYDEGTLEELAPSLTVALGLALRSFI
jgi:type IV pilus assembly protein PilM